MSSNEVELIPSGTAAQATPLPYDAEGLESLVLTAFGLAGAESMGVVTIDRETGVTATVYDSNGVELTLTATAPSAALEGGPKYGFTRTATAGSSRLVGHPRRL